ncbi:hypothetical protein ACFQ3N_13815 [Virgibacillus byunsanensis]|uniref:Cytosolic protein n=1 Tax=Virgibacillus byunsanensis TaxID=570945 RepID=A0ABW3LQ47_9BACI
MAQKREKNYSDFSNVKNVRNYLVPEEFPDGPLGSPINEDELASSKSTPWEEGQRRQSAFNYPYKEMHEDLPRQTPGSHPIHDEPDDVHPLQEEQEKQ